MAICFAVPDQYPMTLASFHTWKLAMPPQTCRLRAATARTYAVQPALVGMAEAPGPYDEGAVGRVEWNVGVWTSTSRTLVPCSRALAISASISGPVEDARGGLQLAPGHVVVPHPKRAHGGLRPADRPVGGQALVVDTEERRPDHRRLGPRFGHRRSGRRQDESSGDGDQGNRARAGRPVGAARCRLMGVVLQARIGVTGATAGPPGSRSARGAS